MELNSYFRGLLSNIEPNQCDIDRAKQAHEDLRQLFLLDDEISKADPDSYLSGSYARDTALNHIKDVDIILLIALDYKSTEPEVVLAWVQAALQQYYSQKVIRQGRSVKVTTDNGFVLDVVPAVPLYHRDGPVWIPDRDVRQWVLTHPKGQIEFGVNKNKATQGYYKHLVKIMKHWRDRLPTEIERANSYIIESLVAKSLHWTPLSYGRGVVDIFHHIYSNYAAYLNLHTVPIIADPGYPSVNVAKRWKFEEFKAFIQATRSSLSIASSALADEEKEKSIMLWKKLFGEKFSPREE